MTPSEAFTELRWREINRRIDELATACEAMAAKVDTDPEKHRREALEFYGRIVEVPLPQPRPQPGCSVDELKRWALREDNRKVALVEAQIRAVGLKQLTTIGDSDLH